MNKYIRYIRHTKYFSYRLHVMYNTNSNHLNDAIEIRDLNLTKLIAYFKLRKSIGSNDLEKIGSNGGQKY